MKFTQRFKKGLRLTKQAFSIMKKIKHLYLLPVIAAFTTLAAMIIYVYGLSSFYGGFEPMIKSIGEDGSQTFALGLITYAFFFISQFITIFMNVATMAAIREYLAGRPSSVKIGIEFAKKRIGVILKWALFSFAITVVLNKIEQFLNSYTRFGGTITRYFLGAAIGIATYFILPVLAFSDNTSIKEALKRSTKMMKEQFAENITSKLYLSAITTVVTLVIAVVFFVLLFLTPLTTMFTENPAIMLAAYLSIMALFIATVIICAMYFGLVNNILNVALYNYAQNGEITNKFDCEFIVQK